ncbi:SGNH/GDSL hydrolase family protein [Humisphaera borealis]|uniref:SGNH/GDSL hydrolase family protein n=1 Tax=Humisphaera borealis TaxID=2807512 RepID=A0A7M2X287_9BACT|nr:SGNH/GDSL hydrolase family protein [Humisphaera borealis]QOV91171.1 SGNH/GDSL hydrolase family protein [Humisphaera borealis]
MNNPIRLLVRSALLIAVSVFSGGALADTALTPKANDIWVMAGDSITAQRQHSNFIETFYRTRHPELNLQFRNSGIGGNRTGSILARFDYDVAAWKPTIVSIELGMNDVSAGDDPAGYIKGMRDLLKRIRDIKATPVFISSSPVNDGSLPGNWKSDRCRRIDPYTVALKKLAEEEGVAFVDQYHPLLEMWGKNNPQEDAPAPAAAPAANVPPAAGGPAAAKPPVKKPSTGKIPLGGDAVHPGPVGQYTMAATILASLKVDRDVSSATLKADGSVVDARRCKITDAAANNGKLSFTRLDERLPWPVDPKAKTAVDLMPSIADLSQYLLTVKDLPSGKYDVTIEGKPAATVTAEQLAAGWNMSTVFEGAIGERSTKVLGLLSTLQGKLNNDWRAASKEKNVEKLAAAQKAIDELEQQIQAACKPAALKFEIQPVK